LTTLFGDDWLKEKLVLSDKLKATNIGANLEFVSDSPEQIKQSILYIRYSSRLAQAFKAAIAKAKKTTQ
jgi:hypothetical protein